MISSVIPGRHLPTERRLHLRRFRGGRAGNNRKARRQGSADPTAGHGKLLRLPDGPQGRGKGGEQDLPGHPEKVGGGALGQKGGGREEREGDSSREARPVDEQRGHG